MAENIPTRARKAGREAPKPPKAPAHLSREAKKLWRELTAAWLIDTDGLLLLQCALEQLDVYRAARSQLAADGPTVKHPETGNIRQHPAAGVARDALRECRQLFRQLALEPPQT